MSLIRKHGAVLQAWACLALVTSKFHFDFWFSPIVHENHTYYPGYARMYQVLF